MGAKRMGPSGEPGETPGSEARPYGTRPYGTRPYGTRPYGTRPYGTRADDEEEERPYGTRPYGTRPYGTRPYGTRPYGTRPYGTRADVPDGVLDRDEWADDVAELFCATSAVLSLGASVVFADCDGDTPVPSIEVDRGVARYLPTRRDVVEPCRPAGATGASSREDSESTLPAPSEADLEKPSMPAARRILRPRDHELAVKVVVPDDLARDLADRPELAWPLKQDLAEDLALSADGAFLRGTGRPSPEPCGISATSGVVQSTGATGIDSFRQIVTELRRTPVAFFRAPGFILGPDVFDAVAKTSLDSRSLDSTRLLEYDSRRLFGYPYAISPAAGQQVYFSADWGEAWIACDRALVTIDVSTSSHFQTDETVIRAVMRHDFLVRRPAAFRYMAWVP
jgi:capsid protein